jgi:hypothetical protein
MNSHELLVLIDTDYEKAYGPIRISKYCGSNMYMLLLEHRRWQHPRYEEYLKLKEEEMRKR